MTSEHPREQRAQEQGHDLRKPETIERILQTGTPSELEALGEFYGLTLEQVEREKYYLEMRENLREQSREATEERMRTRPEASREEMDLGAYWEELEAPVREAVKTFQRKGYALFEYGFSDIGGNQLLKIDPPLPMEFDLPKELHERLASQGITLTVMPNTIQFEPKQILTVEELTRAWNDVAEAMPTIGSSAPPVQTKSALRFREKRG